MHFLLWYLQAAHAVLVVLLLDAFCWTPITVVEYPPLLYPFMVDDTSSRSLNTNDNLALRVNLRFEAWNHFLKTCCHEGLTLCAWRLGWPIETPCVNTECEDMITYKSDNRV